jgi:hypothetical protein
MNAVLDLLDTTADALAATWKSLTEPQVDESELQVVDTIIKPPIQ